MIAAVKPGGVLSGYPTHNYSHFVVVVGATDEVVRFNDPDRVSYPVEVPKVDFIKAWSRRQYRMAVLVPAG